MFVIYSFTLSLLLKHKYHHMEIKYRNNYNLSYKKSINTVYTFEIYLMEVK